MNMAEEEHYYTIPLRDVKNAPKWKRSNRAIKLIRKYLAKHLKTEESMVRLSDSINKKVWERGSEKPPRKVRVRAMKFDDGVVEAEMVETG